MKLCSKCGKNKQREGHSYCNKCNNEYHKVYNSRHPGRKKMLVKRRQNDLREMIRELKSKPCTDCKIQYPWYVMDFDHVRGVKKFNISIAIGRRLSVSSILEEVKKCDLVCSNCHRERTFN